MQHRALTGFSASTKRRDKLAKWFLNFAYRVQYSIFEMNVDESTMIRVLDGIHRYLDEEEDSVIIYELDASDWEKKMLIGIQAGEKSIYDQDFAIIG